MDLVRPDLLRGTSAITAPARRHDQREPRRVRAASPPEAFDIAFTAVPIASVDSDDEPIPVCRKCGGLAAIFLDHGPHWQHFRGDGTTSGAQQIYEPGHAPEVTWILPDEDLDAL
jgi:hypothetical protein